MAVVVLILIGLASLVTGMLVDDLRWVYAAAAATALALILLGVDALRGRRAAASEKQDSTEGDSSGTGTIGDENERSEIAADVTSADKEDEESEPNTAEPAPASDTASNGDLVQVVPGRKRYHAPGCALIVEETTEDLTLDEARAEGFTPCTKCAASRTAASASEATSGA